MHPNQATLAACCAHDAKFNDDAFALHGYERVTGMWRMLCKTTGAKALGDWKLTSSGIEADAKTGKARWEAYYCVTAIGRLVHNVIESVFEFNEQGLMARYRDSFNFWTWSRLAIAAPGLLLGWTPFLRRKVRSTAAANLKKFLASRKV